MRPEGINARLHTLKTTQLLLKVELERARAFLIDSHDLYYSGGWNDQPYNDALAYAGCLDMEYLDKYREPYANMTGLIDTIEIALKLNEPAEDIDTLIYEASLIDVVKWTP